MTPRRQTSSRRRAGSSSSRTAGNGESTLYGSEFEIRLRNKLTQRAIARECADWVRRKVRFRSNRTGAPMQQFAIVDDTAAYLPLQGFTSADLGYERGNAVSNMVTKLDEAPMTAQYVQLFDQIWHNPDQLDDVTETVYDHIASVYAENSPSRIYFLILYNLFAEFLDDINEDVLPNDRTGYQDTAIWKALYDFQRDAATGVDQQARDLQRLHPRRQRRPREDVHGAGGHQVLRAAQQVGARARAEEAGRQLDELQRQPHHQHLRDRTASTTTCSPTPTCPGRRASRWASRSTG